MKAIDAYRDMQKELDKYESPTFSVRDFNLFYNKALSKYIDLNYAQKDIRLKDDVDLQSLIKLNIALILSPGGAQNVPTDFRTLLALKVKVKFKVNIGRYKTGLSYEFWPEKMKSGQKGFRFRGAYGRPKYNRFYYEISQGVLNVLFDAASVEFETVANCWLDYIIQPSEVFLNPDTSANYGLEANNTTLVFNTGAIRNGVYFEVLNVCRSLFLENIESPRAQAAMQESVLQQ